MRYIALVIILALAGTAVASGTIQSVVDGTTVWRLTRSTGEEECVPKDPGNRTHQEIQAWLASGNSASAPVARDPKPSLRLQLYTARTMLDAINAELAATPGHAGLTADRDRIAALVTRLRNFAL